VSFFLQAVALRPSRPLKTTAEIHNLPDFVRFMNAGTLAAKVNVVGETEA
jgi:hypothetical protein